MRIQKSNPNDFSVNDLPSNRIEVFFDVFKLHWRTLFFVGLMLILFAIPMTVTDLIFDLFKYQVTLKFTDGLINEAELSSQLNTLMLTNYAVVPFVFAILGIGVSGILRIIKRLCYLQPVFIKDDFFLGIKQNWKLVVPIFFITGILNFLGMFLYKSFPNNFIAYIPFGLIALFVYPPFMIFIFASSIYNIRFISCLQLSYKIYIRRLITALGFYIVLVTPIAFFLIPDAVVKYIVIITYLGVVLPLIFVILFLYHSYIFDVLINKERYPDLFDRGVHRKKVK